ncbi:MAG: ribonuclease P protein component [Bacteroidia bacterium]|nr:ribonuclease P protein component [Bacteroidia bacterium]
MGKQFSFKKEERLAGEKHIQELFEKGSSFNLYPFRVLRLSRQDSNNQLVKVLISVSKRNFKRAVDRNLIKRRIREAYRLQKGHINEYSLLLAIVYTAKEIEPFRVIKDKLFLVLEKIKKFGALKS